MPKKKDKEKTTKGGKKTPKKDVKKPPKKTTGKPKKKTPQKKPKTVKKKVEKIMEKKAEDSFQAYVEVIKETPSKVEEPKIPTPIPKPKISPMEKVFIDAHTQYPSKAINDDLWGAFFGTVKKLCGERGVPYTVAELDTWLSKQ